MATKKAAIDLDDLGGQPLEKVSAADFLTALNGSGVVHLIGYWPEKKKFELWVEPENIGKIDVGRLKDILEREKKKVEYELPPWFDRIPPVFERPMFGAGVADPNPQPNRLERLVESLDHRLRMLEERLG